MVTQRKVVDTSAVLGVKAFFDRGHDAHGADLEDDPVTVEIEFSPGAQSILHIHPEQDESYEVLSGRLDLYLDGRWNSVGPGESVNIARGQVHAFRNSSGETARALNVHRPALRFQEYLEVMERLIRERKVTGRSGLRNGIYLSLHAAQYRREVLAVRPPDWFLRMMARIGRILGYRLE